MYKLSLTSTHEWYDPTSITLNDQRIIDPRTGAPGISSSSPGNRGRRFPGSLQVYIGLIY